MTHFVPGGAEERAVLDNALKELFDAYDVDQCGYISKDIWFKIEMALAFDRGDEYDIAAQSASFNHFDIENTGQISFHEFRDRQLRAYTNDALSVEVMIKKTQQEVLNTYAERRRLGPRFAPEIRQLLLKLFRAYDTNGDGLIQIAEYLEGNFRMFEGSTRTNEQIG